MGATAGKVIVTGAQGFLGRYLVREFADGGWHTIGVDREGPESGSGSSASGREAVSNDIRHMTLPSPEFADLLEEEAPALIVHAAGSASVQDSVRDPARDFECSVPLFLSVLDAVRTKAPACNVIFLSSAAVYGDPESLPITEEHALKPISPYGYHKLLCEKLAEEYHSVFGVPICSARIFSAYGPGLQRQVLWDICRKGLASETLELLGTGDETRDFIHARDIASGIRRMAEGAAFGGETYNLASGRETTIRELADVLVQALGTTVKIVFTGEHRRGDPLRWRADISRLAGLGYHPAISIRAGAAEYAGWVLEGSARPARNSC